jgi:hypothetical protein
MVMHWSSRIDRTYGRTALSWSNPVWLLRMTGIETEISAGLIRDLLWDHGSITRGEHAADTLVALRPAL